MKSGIRRFETIGIGVLILVLTLAFLANAEEAFQVREVVLETELCTIAVFGQLTFNGDPIPESIFILFVGLEHPPLEKGVSVTRVLFEDSKGNGILANGAQITYIIPGNGTVSFAIAPDQFVRKKRYWLEHLPNDPPGAAAVAFF